MASKIFSGPIGISIAGIIRRTPYQGIVPGRPPGPADVWPTLNLGMMVRGRPAAHDRRSGHQVARTEHTMAGTSPDIPRIPASFFGMVLGIGGLAADWRAAHRAWGMPATW